MAKKKKGVVSAVVRLPKQTAPEIVMTASSALREPAAIPSVTAPKTPEVIVIDRALSKQLKAPTAVQENAATDIAMELRRAKNYGPDFGVHVPPRETLASSFELAAAWTREAQRARAWFEYTEAQRRFAWNHGLLEIAPLQREYLHVMSMVGGLADRYPALHAFFGSRKASAKRAVATRRANKRKNAAQQAQ